jgi:hypothetical protein
MIKHIKFDVLHVFFALGIMILFINICVAFNVIDLIYMFFLVGCYVRYLMIRGT